MRTHPEPSADYLRRTLRAHMRYADVPVRSRLRPCHQLAGEPGSSLAKIHRAVGKGLARSHHSMGDVLANLHCTMGNRRGRIHRYMTNGLGQLSARNEV